MTRPSSLGHLNHVLNNQEEGFLVTLSEEDSEAIETAHKSALREALQVDTELLTEYFDGLGTQYREKFITGLQDKINGAENSSALRQLRGNMLLNQWNDWYGELFDAIWDAL